MVNGDFSKQFAELTGHPPFPWQMKLYEMFVHGPQSIPNRCDIPTGLGKTSVIAIWLLARDACPALPRRLVYVVNRRTVVDQTTNEVERVRENLLKIGRHASDLAISTLRGQYADNREWSADPSRPAVICGTVDMIGSRLLFSGYGIGRSSKPLHAGFLGQDTLIIHDEAHLEPAFQQLLLAIQNEQTNGRFKDKHPLRVMELSATSRTATDDKPFELTLEEKAATKESSGVLAEVGKRIRATKALLIHSIEDERRHLADEVARLALVHEKEPGRAILVFVRSVDDLAKVVTKLPNDRTRQLTGTMRGLERDALFTDPIFTRFLPKPPDTVTPCTVYLVCTSAGEVGVNISADHLVCDLSTFESMAQRFGRVNRFGLRDDTRIDVVHPSSFDDPKKLIASNLQVIDALRKTLALLQSRVLNGSASPHALSQLDAKARADAFAPTPTILPVTDILFDSWAMTSITGKLPGRPKVEPYLHGIADWEPPQTKVAWREEVGVITGDLLEEYDPADLLEAYPLKPHELLTDRSDRIWKELISLAERFSDRPVWIVDTDGTVNSTLTLADLKHWDKKRAEFELRDQVIVLPHDVGGLTRNGLLDGTYPPSSKAGVIPEEINNDVADAILDKDDRPLRVRFWSVDSEPPLQSQGLRLIKRIDIPTSDTDDDAPVRSWQWFEQPAPADNSKHSIHPVVWQTHTDDVVKRSGEIATGLGVDAKLHTVVTLAAKFHDLGKRRDLWQRMIGRPSRLKGHWFAKSGRRWKGTDSVKYRHEFGSLLDLESEPDFVALDDESKELVLHLIAAHHGMARPHFELEQMIDLQHPDDLTERLAMEVPRRFARLQRRYGRWGLAYIESLLRAADWAASANPSEYFREEPT